jgi:hypothetical protein
MASEGHIVADCHWCVLGIQWEAWGPTHCWSWEGLWGSQYTLSVRWLEHLQIICKMCISNKSVKICGMPWTMTTMVQMLAPNCTSLSSTTYIRLLMEKAWSSRLMRYNAWWRNLNSWRSLYLMSLWLEAISPNYIHHDCGWTFCIGICIY